MSCPMFHFRYQSETNHFTLNSIVIVSLLLRLSHGEPLRLGSTIHYRQPMTTLENAFQISTGTECRARAINSIRIE